MSYRGGSGDGAYSRSHARAASSVDGGNWALLPPLPIKDTLLLHLGFLRQGLSDACKGEAVIDTLATNKVVQANTTKSSILQGVVLFSALVIQPLLGRLVPGDYSSSQSKGGLVFLLFHVFWLYPLAVASIVYSGLLKAPMDLGSDRRASSSRGAGNDYRGLTNALVGESYKMLVLLNYLAFVFILRRIPLIGGPIAFLYACIVDSYYLYEQQWLKLHWPLEERLKNLDSRWAYFIGFGFPITFLSWWSSDPVVNLALFSFFFPLFQIMSSSSIAQPIDPSLPTSSMSLSFLPQSQGSFSMAAAEGGEEARGRAGNPLIPTRIPVLIVADKLYKLLVASFGAPTVRKKDAGGGGAHYALHDPHVGGSAGWRGDYMGATPAYPAGPVAGPREPLQYGFGQQPSYINTPPSHPPPPSGPPPPMASMGMASATTVTPVGFGQSPPRRGHVQNESVMGVGGEFVDRSLDKLINQAGMRKKGD